MVWRTGLLALEPLRSESPSRMIDKSLCAAEMGFLDITAGCEELL